MQKLLDCIYLKPSLLLNKCKSNFENIVVLGDFNLEPTNQVMTTFMADNDFMNIIKSNTFFKTSTGRSINLKLTSHSILHSCDQRIFQKPHLN